MGRLCTCILLFCLLLSNLNFISAEPVNDLDRDGIQDDLDYCPETTYGEYVDDFGCSWGESDYDSDGLLNSYDDCPTVYLFDCGQNGTEYYAGPRVITEKEHDPWMFLPGGRTEFIYHCSLGIYQQFSLVSPDLNPEKCDGLIPDGHSIHYGVTKLSHDGENFAYLHNDIIQTEWGSNQSTESFTFDISPIGDFVVWLANSGETDENGYDNYYRELWIWNNGSQPELLFKSHLIGALQNRSGGWVDISPDGRYILLHHGFMNDNPHWKNTILDSHSGNVVKEFPCQNQVWLEKSNTVVCIRSGTIEFINIDSNTSDSFIDTGLNNVRQIHASPSDNQLLLLEERDSKVTLVDLTNGNLTTYNAPTKDGFDLPEISGAMFFHTDELILTYTHYQKSHPAPDQHGFNYGYDEYQLLGMNYAEYEIVYNTTTPNNGLDNTTTPNNGLDNTTTPNNGLDSLPGEDSFGVNPEDSGSSDNLEKSESDQYLSDSEITMISIAFMVLIPCFIFLHKPTLRSVTNTIRSISPNAVGLDRVERQREELEENLSFDINTDSLSNILLAPFVIMYYCVAGILIAMFYLIQIYLIVAGYALLIVFGGTMFIILLPFFLFAFIFG